MSRPRKPFGANHPGRLPATMMKVLAAEMSDPSRLRRGKQYAKDGSVLDIIIETGVVTCEVQGSRSMPYVASVAVTAGDGMPLRRDITTTCTCPDDDNWDGYACKHVVATMFTMADEFLLEPELLDVWRGRSGASEEFDDAVDVTDDDVAEDDPVVDAPPLRRRGHLRLVGDDERVTPSAPATPTHPRTDRLADLLRAPEGRQPPEIPELERVATRPPKDRQLAAVLRDALANVRIEWD